MHDAHIRLLWSNAVGMLTYKKLLGRICFVRRSKLMLYEEIDIYPFPYNFNIRLFSK